MINNSLRRWKCGVSDILNGGFRWRETGKGEPGGVTFSDSRFWLLFNIIQPIRQLQISYFIDRQRFNFYKYYQMRNKWAIIGENASMSGILKTGLTMETASLNRLSYLILKKHLIVGRNSDLALSLNLYYT